MLSHRAPLVRSLCCTIRSSRASTVRSVLSRCVPPPLVRSPRLPAAATFLSLFRCCCGWWLSAVVRFPPPPPPLSQSVLLLLRLVTLCCCSLFLPAPAPPPLNPCRCCCGRSLCWCCCIRSFLSPFLPASLLSVYAGAGAVGCLLSPVVWSMFDLPSPPRRCVSSQSVLPFCRASGALRRGLRLCLFASPSLNPSIASCACE